MAGQGTSQDFAQGIARSVEMLVRLKVQEIKGERNNTDMIYMLAGLGATSGEISTLLGMKPTSVMPILSRARAKGKAKPKVKK